MISLFLWLILIFFSLSLVFNNLFRIYLGVVFFGLRFVQCFQSVGLQFSSNLESFQQLFLQLFFCPLPILLPVFQGSLLHIIRLDEVVLQLSSHSIVFIAMSSNLLMLAFGVFNRLILLTVFSDTIVFNL